MMDNKVSFENHTGAVTEKMKKAIVAALYEAGNDIMSQAMQNTAVDYGQLKGSWKLKVDSDKYEAVIGSPLENAIWEEFGTGEYALNGNGRKGGWFVHESQLSKKAKGLMKGQKRISKNGEVYYFTLGKKPKRMLYNAFESCKTDVPAIIKSKLGDKLKGGNK